MTIEPSELLERISTTLRHEVGPAVGDEYNRTQTFMASVILGKLAKQLALDPVHRAAEETDLRALHENLANLMTDAPAEVVSAAERAEATGTTAALTPLISALYNNDLDDHNGQQMLALIRLALRADIDRRMEIAR